MACEEYALAKQRLAQEERNRMMKNAPPASFEHFMRTSPVVSALKSDTKCSDRIVDIAGGMAARSSFRHSCVQAKQQMRKWSQNTPTSAERLGPRGGVG